MSGVIKKPQALSVQNPAKREPSRRVGEAALELRILDLQFFYTLQLVISGKGGYRQ